MDAATIPSAGPSRVARATRTVARLTGPLTRPLAGRRSFPLWAVVHHRGRRSGRSYAVPVAIRVVGDVLTIPLPWGDRTQWLRNVTTAGGCTIRWCGGSLEATEPRVIGWDEAADAFHPLQRAVMRAGGISHFLRLRAAGPV